MSTKKLFGNAAILEGIFLRGEIVSCLTINQRLQTTSGQKYVSILKQNGLPIISVWKKSNGGKKFKAYSLDSNFLKSKQEGNHD